MDINMGIIEMPLTSQAWSHLNSEGGVFASSLREKLKVIVNIEIGLKRNLKFSLDINLKNICNQ